MSAPESSPRASWSIRSGAVGAVALGKRLPPELLEGDLEARYRARTIGDGQPWEGFALADPPLMVGIGAGLAALRTAYADLSLRPVPPTLGDDECVAATGALAGVFFLFRSCRDAESGAAVTRIDLREP